MFTTTVYQLNELINKDSIFFTKSINGKKQISSSVEFGSKICLSLNCDKRLAVKTARLMLRNDKSNSISYVESSEKCINFTECVFTFEIDTKSLCSDTKEGLFFYSFELDTVYGTLYSVRRNKFHSSFLNTITDNYKSPLDLSFDKSYRDESLYPLTVFDMSHPRSFDLRGAVIYHVFVDRFCKGEGVKIRKDSNYNDDWYNGIPEFAPIPGGDIPNNTHFGGNIPGIIQKLDYIKSLGADYLYLSPVFKAYSNHKYDTGNYEIIDENFGGDKAFKNLILKCEDLGIKIILDGVFNHTGDDSVYFNKYSKYKSLGAFQSKESLFYNWFDFKDYPNEYQCWWGVKCLPTVKKHCPEFWEYIAGKNGIISKYAKMGVKGFRLDVVDELDQRFLTQISDTLRECGDNNCLIGEVWEDASIKVAYDTRKNYFSTGNLDGVINYPFRKAIIDFVLSKDAFSFANAVCSITENYPHHQLLCSMIVLSTHDTERIVSLLGNPGIGMLSPTEQSKFKLTSDQLVYAKELQKLAACLQFTLPGAPTLYYGDETSMEGGKDPFNRLCYPWGNEDNDMIAYYKTLCDIHQSNQALKYGDLHFVNILDKFIAFERCYSSQKCLVIVNTSNEEVQTDLSIIGEKDLITQSNVKSNRLKPLSALIIQY